MCTAELCYALHPCATDWNKHLQGAGDSNLCSAQLSHAHRTVFSPLTTALLCTLSWFDKDENSSGQLGSALSTDAAVIRGAVGDVFGVVVQNLACMAAGGRTGTTRP